MHNFDLLSKNKCLTNYYYYSKGINDEDIAKIIQVSKKYQVIDGTISDGLDSTYRKSKIIWIPLNDETQFIYDKIVFLLKDANKNMWNFNITNIIDKLQLSEYEGDNRQEEQGHYDWHMDFGENNSTRKISLTVQLSNENDYENGDLEFMVHRTILKAPREKGSVIIFPSYLTHRVTNVTKGKRKSLVFWIHGPPFV